MKIMISGAGNAGADHGRDDRGLDVDADDHLVLVLVYLPAPKS
ncbi:hypothetical protein [Bradyrhizobium sp. Rc2d]|nr:hypothetical protein [Bradyrhizobium sp. Rc2d]